MDGFRRAAVSSGIIREVWHWPAVLGSEYNVGTPVPYALLCLTAMVMTTSVF
ncbi:MAG: hypothetical protein QOJ99_4488 [Bryobacterales bacterium]|jgi:hypothetical protein|nr:hypothetical protein [Bryobacterales bacterium]